MKKVSIALTLGILLLSSAMLVTMPKNIIAQQAEDTDYTVTEEEIKAKITEFKAKHPKFAAVVEEIPNLDLKETVKGYLAAGAIQKFLKFHAKNLVEEKVANATGASTDSSPLEETLTDEQIQAKVTEFKTKHPKFAAIVEGISNLDLKETVKAYLGAEVLQKLFKYHAKNLVQEAVAPATP
jgi:cytochrome c556